MSRSYASLEKPRNSQNNQRTKRSARNPADRESPPAQPVIQRQSNASAGFDDPSSLRSTAREGTRGPGSTLPFFSRIQSCFGDHDLSGVRTHQDAGARQSAQALKAHAYTFGEDMVFDRPPSLFTVAHEAAHVVQQRSGVTLQNGIDKPGDAHEKQADAVANAVANGQSAAKLLPGATNRSNANVTTPSVQRISYEAVTKNASQIENYNANKIIGELHDCIKGIIGDKSKKSNRVYQAANAIKIFRERAAEKFENVKSVHGYYVGFEHALFQIWEYFDIDPELFPSPASKEKTIHEMWAETAHDKFMNNANSKKSKNLRRAATVFNHADEAMDGTKAVNGISWLGKKIGSVFGSISQKNSKDEDKKEIIKKNLKAIKAESLDDESVSKLEFDDIDDDKMEIQEHSVDDEDFEITDMNQVFDSHQINNAAKSGAKNIATKLAKGSAKKAYSWGLALATGGISKIIGYSAQGLNAVTSTGTIVDYCNKALDFLMQLERIHEAHREEFEDQVASFYDERTGKLLARSLNHIRWQSATTSLAKVGAANAIDNTPMSGAASVAPNVDDFDKGDMKRKYSDSKIEFPDHEEIAPNTPYLQRNYSGSINSINGNSQKPYKSLKNDASQENVNKDNKKPYQSILEKKKSVDSLLYQQNPNNPFLVYQEDSQNGNENDENNPFDLFDAQNNGPQLQQANKHEATLTQIAKSKSDAFAMLAKGTQAAKGLMHMNSDQKHETAYGLFAGITSKNIYFRNIAAGALEKIFGMDADEFNDFQNWRALRDRIYPKDNL